MSQTIVLGSPVQCSDAHEGIAFLAPRVSGIVLDEHTMHLDYLVVHRGLLRTHDQCVPGGDIHTADSECVQLSIGTKELKALPELEAKVTGGTHTQRIVSAHALVLGKGVPVIDEAGQAVGQFSGVIIGSERRVEQILVAQPLQTAIPVDQLISCTEDNMRVRQTTGMRVDG